MIVCLIAGSDNEWTFLKPRALEKRRKDSRSIRPREAQFKPAFPVAADHDPAIGDNCLFLDRADQVCAPERERRRVRVFATN